MLPSHDFSVLIVYCEPYGLDNLDIAGENDGNRKGEAEHVDVEDIGHVHHGVLARPIPFNTTAVTDKFSHCLF